MEVILKEIVNMINNFICEECNHFSVCENVSKLMKFHESARKDLGITITVDECDNYAQEDDEE